MHLNKCYEVIFNFTMERDIRLDKLAIGVPYKAKSNIERVEASNNEDIRDVSNIWLYTHETIQSNLKDGIISPFFQSIFQKDVSNYMDLPRKIIL